MDFKNYNIMTHDGQELKKIELIFTSEEEMNSETDSELDSPIMIDS